MIRLPKTGLIKWRWSIVWMLVVKLKPNHRSDMSYLVRVSGSECQRPALSSGFSLSVPNWTQSGSQ